MNNEPKLSKYLFYAKLVFGIMLWPFIAVCLARGINDILDIEKFDALAIPIPGYGPFYVLSLMVFAFSIYLTIAAYKGYRSYRLKYWRYSNHHLEISRDDLICWLEENLHILDQIEELKRTTDVSKSPFGLRFDIDASRHKIKEIFNILSAEKKKSEWL